MHPEIVAANTESRLDLEQSVRDAVRIKPQAWFLVDPRGEAGRYLGYWDVVVGIALMFTALVTPYEVALLPTRLDTLFGINRIIDLLFLADIVLQFVLVTPESSSAIASTDGVFWVTEPKLIVKRYLRGWFAIDIFSVAVSLAASAFGLNNPAPYANLGRCSLSPKRSYPSPGPRLVLTDALIAILLLHQGEHF